jgi:glycosyltransferase involved in cell wall biosynthesis
MRSIYLGLLNILLFNPNPTKVYHTVSTGYAGIVASMCKVLYPSAKVMLTEHGIYTRERLMEVAISDWPDIDKSLYDSSKGISIYQNIWVDFFAMMSKVCYNYADQIISLHHKNNEIQIAEGANPSKVISLHNGIDLNKFEFIKRSAVRSPTVVGFLGRIVKIKDVKTLIKTASIVCEKLNSVIFKLAGPFDEDKEYYEECKEFVDVLGLNDKVLFLGKVDSAAFFKEIDIMILTSLSEGQPLVISEAASCGVPTVATNVGGCFEMIEGYGEDSIGTSGIITNSVSPNDSANAIIKMITDSAFYERCSINGRVRAERFYNEVDFIYSYQKLYERNLGWLE